MGVGGVSSSSYSSLGRDAKRKGTATRGDLPPPARNKRSDGLPPSEGKAPRPPCGEGLLCATEPLRRTERAWTMRRTTLCIAVMPTTLQTWVLPQNPIIPSTPFENPLLKPLFLSSFSSSFFTNLQETRICEKGGKIKASRRKPKIRKGLKGPQMYGFEEDLDQKKRCVEENQSLSSYLSVGFFFHGFVAWEGEAEGYI